MRYDEAIKFCEGYLPECDLKKIAIDALEKNTPKKPVLISVRKAIFLDNADEQYKALGYPHRNIRTIRCPACEKYGFCDEGIPYKFCYHCGQALDWSDEL